MDLGIGLGFGLGPRLRAGLRPRVGPSGGLPVAEAPCQRAGGMVAEASLSVEAAGVGAPAIELLV